MSTDSRSPLGALPTSANSVRFEVWSPYANRVTLELVEHDGQSESLLTTHDLAPAASGIWALEIEANVGVLYRYSIDGQPGRPDPRSRFQPFGVHGPSQVIDPTHDWQDADWKGVAKRDLIIYEMHIGSFTPDGTYAAATNRLDELVELGITAIELLPLAQSPGRWNWGYDGVNYFAPRNTFGSPSALKDFVDACHARSIAVINDVVYNHIGPEGNYLSSFGPYKSSTRDTPWGDAFNFDGKDARQVRQFVLDNIEYWIKEFHLDGVRLDAVHYMFDDSEYPILDEIRDEFKSLASALDREVFLIGESNIYDPHLVGDVANDNPHHDAVWSDCIMHSIYTVGDPDLRLTNRHYKPTDLSEAIEHAYVFSTPNAIRVTPKIREKHHANEDRRYMESLIMALQTHDSVGNHPHGKRLHQLTSVEFQKAAAPLILLYPSIAMIFMGEERATESPFPFFADFEDKSLRNAVDRGRRDEYPHHDWKGSPLPSDELAFTSTRFAEGDQNVLTWYQSLIAFRKSGIADGWLCVDGFSTTSDVESNTYRLIFDHPQGQLNVVSRLSSGDAAAIPLTGESIKSLLFDSRSVDTQPRALDAPAELQAQHCLIWHS